MNDIVLKLRMLWHFFLSNPVGWYHEIWKQDADERLCCNGRECGCMGATFADELSYHLPKKGQP